MISKASRWRRAMAATVGGLLIGTAAACGVPSSGSPVVDGAVNPNGSPGGGGQAAGPPPPGAFDAATQPVSFVEGYLAALGALPPTATADDEIAAAQAWIKVKSCKPTVSPCGGWPQSATITVIRAPVGNWIPTHFGLGWKVSGDVQIIGMFTPATGVIQPLPPNSKTTMHLDFSVQPDPGSGSGNWRLEDPRHTLLISEDAMSTWYTAHAVYFWNADHTALIPDIHYLSSTLGNPGSLREATQIIDWVLEGDSSPWLAQSGAGSIAPGVVLKDPTVKVAGPNTNRFVVNLSANARGLDHADLLASELRWSLGNITANPRGSWPSDVELQVDGQELTTSEFNNYRNDAPNLKPPRAYPTAASFGIMASSATSGGAVTEFEIGQTNPPVLQQLPKESRPPVLDSQKNSNVLLAAVDGTRSAAALVRRNARTGANELWVRWLKPGTPTDFQQVQGLAGAMLRPQFIVQPQSDQTTTAVCVVSVAGKLYTVSPGQTPVVEQIVPSNVGAISAFSVAPDGHRIAYVSGGKLYVSMLTPGSAGLALAQGNEINTAPGTRNIPDPREMGLDTVTHVVWSSVGTLLVAGQRGQRSVVEQMSVDGSSAYDFDKDYGTSAIEQIAWYVYDPMRPAPTSYNSLLIQRLGSPGETGSSVNPVALQIVVSGHVVNLYNPFFQD